MSFNPNEKMEIIVSVVSEYTGISTTCMKSNTRKKEIVKARQMIAYFGCQYMKNFLSLAYIGSHIKENYNHATVIYGHNLTRDTIERYPNDRKAVSIIAGKIEAVFSELKTKEEAMIAESNNYEEAISPFVQKIINRLNRKNNNLYLMEVKDVYRKHHNCILSSNKKEAVIKALDALNGGGYYAVNCRGFHYHEGHGAYIDSSNDKRMTIEVSNIKAY